MILTTSVDSIISLISITVILIILLSLMLRKLNQTYIIGYIMVGIFLGQDGFNVVAHVTSIKLFGEIGVLLLLFFIGMEINLVDFLKQWKIALLGTLIQVLISVLLILVIGYFFTWTFARSIVIGFVIALSSSAVVIKLLQDKNLMTTKMGKNVLSILLTQDVIFVPMLIIITQLGGETHSISHIITMTLGAIITISILLYIYYKRNVSFSIARRMARDHELQVFIAIFLCFSGALLTSVFGLSAALGAFIGGLIINASREASWIHDTLQSFRVVFVSLFFISIGLQIDLTFIYQNFWMLFFTILMVYLTNQFINSLILRSFSCTWRESFLGGALLAQIGELSFLMSSTALHLNIIGDFGYTFTISIISLTLVISPFWIVLIEKIITPRSLKLK